MPDDLRTALQEFEHFARERGWYGEEGTAAVIIKHEKGDGPASPTLVWAGNDGSIEVAHLFYSREQDQWNCLLEVGHGQIIIETRDENGQLIG